MTREVAVRARVMLRAIALCNHLHLLPGLRSFLFVVEANGGMFAGDDIRFTVIVNLLIVHEKLRLVKLVK